MGEAGHLGVSRLSHPWKIGPAQFFDESEQVRGLFAKLIDATADDIAIIPAVSYGVAVASSLIEVSDGDEIVVLQDQFPSNYYPWLELSRRKNARLMVVPRPADLDWTSALLEAIHEQTAVVAVPNVHWTDGSLIDLIEVSKACEQSNAELVLDLSQSLGVLPMSILEINPSFLISAGYKWLLGPYSFGFMYVSPAYQNKLPLEHNWINRKKSEDFAGLVNYRDDFQTGARRFDVGERSNFALTPMAVAALQQIHEWRVAEIQESLARLTNRLATRAARFGLQVIPAQKRAGHIVGLRFPDQPPAGILERLAEQNIFVSLRGTAMRVSPHLYNTKDDIERLLRVLAQSL